MLEGREKLILAILLAIGIVLILTNTVSAFWVTAPGTYTVNRTF